MPGRAFRDQVVLITGASRGIGRELAVQLAEVGARVVLVARSPSELELVPEACRARGAEAVAVQADVTMEAQCRAAVERAVIEFGRLDVLINNAGISMVARFDELPDVEPVEHLMRVNYLGAVYYAASKHAMAGFFDSLRIELASSGVTVTNVYPGFVETGLRVRAAGAGTGRGKGWQAGRIMSADRCAELTLRAAAARRRELVMTARGRASRWLRLVMPGVVDRIAARAVGFSG